MLLYLALGGAALYAWWRMTPHVDASTSEGGKGGGVVLDGNGNPIGQVQSGPSFSVLPDDTLVYDAGGCPVGTVWSTPLGLCVNAKTPSVSAKAPGFGGSVVMAPPIPTSATATPTGTGGVGALTGGAKPCCAECAAKAQAGVGAQPGQPSLGDVAVKAMELARAVGAGDPNARERAAQILELALYRPDPTHLAIATELHHALQSSGFGVGSATQARRVRVAVDNPDFQVGPVGYPDLSGY